MQSNSNTSFKPNTAFSTNTRCSLCGGPHAMNNCSYKLNKNSASSLQQIFESKKRPRKNGEQGEKEEEQVEEFVPLRQKLVRKSTGKEDNFMESYYREYESVARMTEEEVEKLRFEHMIDIEGEDCPNPIRTWKESGLSPDIVFTLKKLKIEIPTPVQMQSFPVVLSGRDLVATAETGSGKTLCYVLPLLMLLKCKPPTQKREGPLAIILVPTRELVEQVYAEIMKFLGGLNFDQSQSQSQNQFPTPPNFNQIPPHLNYPILPPYPENNFYTQTTTTSTTTPSNQLPFYNPHQDFTTPQNYPNFVNNNHNNNNNTYRHHPSTENPYPNYYTPPPFHDQNNFNDQRSFNNNQPNYNEQNNFMYPSFNFPRKVLGVVGGVPIGTQIAPIQNGVDIIVATPGRLIDLIMRNVVKLDRLSYLVFDEADKMLDVNTEGQVREIVTRANICPRQTVLFSATMLASVERLIRTAVLNPIYIRVGEINTPSESVIQNVIFMHTANKQEKLLSTLRSIERPPVLIFCNNTHCVDWLVNFLKSEQFHVAGLHSEKSQPYRFKAMRAFKEGQLDILVAADLAARGIDVSDVSNVILYEIPETIEDYIHRIGRTGRAGCQGVATVFLTLECKIAEDLKRLLKSSKQEIPKELVERIKDFGKDILKGDAQDFVIRRHR